LHQAQFTFYTDAFIFASLQPIFPRSEPVPLNLRPERRVGEKQRRVPAQMIHGAILQIDKAVAQLTDKYLV
jgi:hypothetical protein